jgi:hypothetical protein
MFSDKWDLHKSPHYEPQDCTPSAHRPCLPSRRYVYTFIEGQAAPRVHWAPVYPPSRSSLLYLCLLSRSITVSPGSLLDLSQKSPIYKTNHNRTNFPPAPCVLTTTPGLIKGHHLPSSLHQGSVHIWLFSVCDRTWKRWGPSSLEYQEWRLQ